MGGPWFVDTGPSDAPGAPVEIGLLDLASGALTALGAGADRPTWTGDGTSVATSIETATGFATLLFDARSGQQTILDFLPAGRPSPDGEWFLQTRSAESQTSSERRRRHTAATLAQPPRRDNGCGV